MKKIISLFKRDYEGNHKVYNEIVPGAEWVVNGEGTATRKFDGTCCMVKDGIIYKRYDVKQGKEKPFGFIPAQDPDSVTGHWPGWVEVGNGNEDKYHREAFKNQPDGTYELCGPKIQGNPEGYKEHVLIPHGKEIIVDCPRNFTDLKDFLSKTNIEGIVWHHPDGRMVKIKKKDF